MLNQKEIEEYSNWIKMVEEKSFLPHYETSQILCVRLDGIKTSRKLLKDSLTHNSFSKNLHLSIDLVYNLFKNFTNPTNENFFSFAFSVSDEVSFILNTGENYYKNRPLKISTVLAGSLSSAFTIHYSRSAKSKKVNSEEFPIVTAFDARPLILEDKSQVEKYIKLRWMLGYRNAMCKTLRLKSPLKDMDIYENGLKNDLSLLNLEIEKYNLSRSLKSALYGSVIHLPDEERKLKHVKVASYEYLLEALQENN